jgi:hypothetical protein
MKTINEYSAVINGTDMIRVKAVSKKEAIRVVSSHCQACETFVMDGETYRVNGRLSSTPATKIRRAA